MIEIHVIVDRNNVNDITNRVSVGKFEVRDRFTTRNGAGFLYIIATDEEEMTALTLKYGKDKVWIR